MPDPMREEWLDWATRTGRILAASRSTWAERWDRDPEVCRSWLSLAAPIEYVAASNASAVTRHVPTYSAALTQTASGLNVNRLPPRLQQAAAREPDRGKVFRWLELYSGMTDAEVDPLTLQIDGEHELATEVRRDEDAAWAAAREAENAAIAAANDAHVRQMAAEQDRRRQEARASYDEARAHYGDAGG